MSDISQEILKEFFEYERSGALIRIKAVHHSRYQIGEKVIGYENINGYRYFSFQGKYRSIHRMIFLLVKGYLPKQIDHKDRNRSNNKIDNLRPATTSQNRMNRLAIVRPGKPRGVHFNKQTKKWFGKVTIDRKQHYTTGFIKREDATRGVKILRGKLFGEYNPE